MKSTMKSFAIAAAALAPLAHSLSTFTAPVSNGPVYSVGIPSSSSISSSSKGGLYFQITAPTSYQWVGLGIGSRMAQATIFVMYADGTGNVTISGRSGGAGHVEPQLDSDLMTGVTLLAGSGIVGGNMVANVHCTTCQLSSDKTSTSAPWIAAWNEGSALNSKSASEDINQHCDDCYAQFKYDLSKAALTSDSNPFITATPSSNPSPTSSGATTSSTGTTSGSNSGDDSGSSSGSDSGSSSTVDNVGRPAKIKSYQQAHGILMGLAATVLFPLGAIFVRLHGHAWVHAGIQLLSLISMIAGLALGVKLGDFTDQLFNNTHSILGVVVVALFLLQPFLGLVHHFLFKKNQSRNVFSHVHIWYGRALMILAVVNGGLGLQLADNTRGGKIAYSVVAGVLGVAYIVAVVVSRKGKPSHKTERPMGDSGS